MITARFQVPVFQMAAIINTRLQRYIWSSRDTLEERPETGQQQQALSRKHDWDVT
jgi:hypothetical protein